MMPLYVQTLLIVLMVTSSQLTFGSASGRSPKPNYIPMQEGACQQYGHSCLGGHGKRNGGDETDPDVLTPDYGLPDSTTQRLMDTDNRPFTSWYLSLLKPKSRPSPYYNAKMVNKLLQFVANANDED